jgi:decaprenylphospho-beta-D-erythro-pentofuranosid-2-ulose 2-reductase
VKRVLILGATSAIAGAAAHVFAARGDKLFLVGRDKDKLARLGASLGASVVGTLVADFDQLGDNEARVSQGVLALGGLDVALIAHGWLGDQRESETSFAHAEAVITTNFTSVVSLVLPLANRFESEGHGSLVVLGSVAGDRGRPRNYTYGAAKGALHLYLQGVRSRLHKSAPGVRVVTVRLGPVDTPMTRDHKKNALFSEPDAVAKTIVESCSHGPEDVYVPWYWQAIMGAVRGMPESIFKRLSFLSGR